MPIELGNELGNNVWGRGYIYYNYVIAIGGRASAPHTFALQEPCFCGGKHSLRPGSVAFAGRHCAGIQENRAAEHNRNDHA